jgi:NADH:ubiquinone oxidoreductase subunit E
VTVFSARSRQRAKVLLERYPDRRSAVMPLLYMAAQDDGYVTDEAMQEVAELTGLTSAQVQAVASFYTMYKRHGVGRYLISVCTSISCLLLGSDDVLAAVEDETGVPDGETDLGDVFSVEHVECIGACGGAPALQVNYELVEGTDPDRARSLCRWLRDGAPPHVRSDEMQQLFGGQRSFDWGPPDPAAAKGPVPAFGPYGTVGGDGS